MNRPTTSDPRRHLWEINCAICGRSSWDEQPDDADGDECPACGQLPRRDDE